MRRRIYILLLLLSICCCAFAQSGSGEGVIRSKVQVVEEYPHDETSYTQGLFFSEGRMYESTGQYGESCFMIVDYRSGKWVRKWKFKSQYFLEGSCIFGDNIYILTWQEHKCFVYSFNNPSKEFKKIGTAHYSTEGWGLTTDGNELIMSDGTSTLYFMDPSSFYCTHTLDVTLEGRPLALLNELEFIEGKIWANVYLSDFIVIINPETGVVEKIIDCSDLLPDSLRTYKTDVLNGIAYNPEDGSIYITGKYWPRLYKIANR